MQAWSDYSDRLRNNAGKSRSEGTHSQPIPTLFRRDFEHVTENAARIVTPMASDDASILFCLLDLFRYNPRDT